MTTKPSTSPSKSLTLAVAACFVEFLRIGLTVTDFIRLCVLNANSRVKTVGICHSNVFMDAAMDTVLGRPVWSVLDVEDGTCTEEQNQRDVNLWNAAWEMAFDMMVGLAYLHTPNDVNDWTHEPPAECPECGGFIPYKATADQQRARHIPACSLNP